jgi:hypothetical protein
MSASLAIKQFSCCSEQVSPCMHVYAQTVCLQDRIDMSASLAIKQFSCCSEQVCPCMHVYAQTVCMQDRSRSYQRLSLVSLVEGISPLVVVSRHSEVTDVLDPHGLLAGLLTLVGVGKVVEVGPYFLAVVTRSQFPQFSRFSGFSRFSQMHMHATNVYICKQRRHFHAVK